MEGFIVKSNHFKMNNSSYSLWNISSLFPINYCECNYKIYSLVIFTSSSTSRFLTSNIYFFFYYRHEKSTMLSDYEFSFIKKMLRKEHVKPPSKSCAWLKSRKLWQIGPFWKLVSHWNEKKSFGSMKILTNSSQNLLLMLLVVVGESRFRYFVGHKKLFFNKKRRKIFLWKKVGKIYKKISFSKLNLKKCKKDDFLVRGYQKLARKRIIKGIALISII